MMAQSVDLAELRQELVRSGKDLSSFTGVLLVSSAVFEALAALRGDGIAMALAGLLPESETSAAGFFWVVTILQVCLLAAGAYKLMQSGVAGNGLVEASPLRSLGATANLDTQAGKIWAGLVAILTLAIFAIPSSIDAPISDKAWILLMVGGPALALAMAALIARGYEARRRLSNSSVLIGVGAALFLVMLISILSDRSPIAEAAVIEGLPLVAGLVLCLGAVAIALSFRSSTDVLIDVTVKNPQAAEKVEAYDPFDRRVRGARYLRFNISRGQIVVLTLKEGATAWKVEPVWNSQYHLPIHDRSLNIWNLNKLSTEISQQIVVPDSSRNFELTIDVGQIMMSAQMKDSATYEMHAIQAASNMLFQNEDLPGLMHRAAARAFSKEIALQMQALHDEEKAKDGEKAQGRGTNAPTLEDRIEAILAMLDQAPTSTSVLAGIDLANAERMSDVSAPAMAQARQKIEEYRDALTTKQAEFRKLVRKVSAAASAVQRAWLDEIASEVINAGNTELRSRLDDTRNESVDTREAIRIIELIGICSNDQSIVEVGLAAECKDRFGAVKEQVELLFQNVNARYTALLEAEDEHDRLVERAIIEKGRFSRNVSQGVAYESFNKRHKRRLTKAPDVEPIHLIARNTNDVRGDDDDGDNGNEGLN